MQSEFFFYTISSEPKGIVANLCMSSPLYARSVILRAIYYMYYVNMRLIYVNMQHDYMYVDMKRTESRMLKYLIISHVE